MFIEAVILLAGAPLITVLEGKFWRFKGGMGREVELKE